MSAAPVGTAWPAGPRKSDRTRTAIVSSALDLFRQRGYEGTTMRAIADAAGVSPATTYYYFRSKVELVQGFYDRLAAEHSDAAEHVLVDGADFEQALHGVLLCWLRVAEPYHAFAGRFFAVAAQPDNPLSPFSSESQEARGAGIELYERLLTSTSPPVDPRLRSHLPELLWLYQLGVVLFWVHDGSPGLRRTTVLVDRTVPMVARLVRLSRLPLLRSLSCQAAELLRVLRS